MTPLTTAKYRSLEALMQRLAAPIAARRLAVSEHWRDDEQAVGFYKPGEAELSAYVFTHGQAPRRYGVHLEYPDPGGDAPGNQPVVCEDIRLQALLDLLNMHFGLQDLSR